MAEKKQKAFKAYEAGHKTCPKCGASRKLAEHANRRTCGFCGYMEIKK